MAEQPIEADQTAAALSGVVERNIQSLAERRRRESEGAGAQERVADRITRFTGSMMFVYIHLVLFGVWVLVNIGLIAFLPKWDESFNMLGAFASVEAIFLSTFVLISQNKMARLQDQNANLDLQISLLSEHEITKLVTLVSAIAEKMQVRSAVDEEVEEIKRDVAPDSVLDKIQEHL